MDVLIGGVSDQLNAGHMIEADYYT
jgi:hypothetical protein